MRIEDSQEGVNVQSHLEEIVEITKRTNYGTWRFQKSWNPIHIVDAKDCTITDGAGKEYLDFSPQLMCSNLGH